MIEEKFKSMWSQRISLVKYALATNDLARRAPFAHPSPLKCGRHKIKSYDLCSSRKESENKGRVLRMRPLFSGHPSSFA